MVFLFTGADALNFDESQWTCIIEAKDRIQAKRIFKDKLEQLGREDLQSEDIYPIRLPDVSSGVLFTDINPRPVLRIYDESSIGG
jgi:hypothetical protein